jgi:glycosyltransferase involved in cell wall biosynthesis
MASGLPVVCSAVGANREVVRDGVDGYLASNDEQWFDRLAALMASPDDRRNFGEVARQRALEHFSLATVAPKMAVLLQGLVAAEHDPETLNRRSREGIS